MAGRVACRLLGGALQSCEDDEVSAGIDRYVLLSTHNTMSRRDVEGFILL